jgi:hypothetical protein
MALRARLAPPPPPARNVWPYHTAKIGSIAAHVLFRGDRRMEGETYLSSGYGIRTAIESKSGAWNHLSQLARSWQPSRLKGIQVSRDFGTPFLAATQVFDVRPIHRKWLALSKTSDASNRFLEPGTIVITCSGSVGRATLSYAVHENTLISHDLLRVEPIQERDRGWIYAYLLAPQTRAMTKSVHYGHIIKHLETSHLDVLPVPSIDDATALDFSTRVSKIVELRNEGYQLTLEAEAHFEKALGSISVKDWGEHGFAIKASKSILSTRRRFDAARHNPGAAAIHRFLAKYGQGFSTLPEAGYEVWVPGRYKRIPIEDGVIYRDSADLLEVNPDLPKRYADCKFGDRFRGRVKDGWILVACSGQVYGIIGTAILATQALNDQVVSNHVLRVSPTDGSVPAGYILTALTHPLLGRPIMKALAFGSSVPEIDVEDLAELPIVRLKRGEELRIAELAQQSAEVRASADLLEREITADAEKIIAKFIAG